MTQAGAPAAYKGYRLQALYTLGRILEPGVPVDRVFQLEGREDLDILSSHGRLLEVIQVKSYESLVLSHLLSEQPRSFFHRVIKILDESPDPPKIKVVNFGEIGPELENAWKQAGPQRRQVSSKLLSKGFSRNEVEKLFDHVTFNSLQEEEETERVLSQLRAFPLAGDAENSFDLLNYWIYLLSEQRAKLTYPALIERLENIGRYLAERQAHHREWFTSIVPLEAHSIGEEERDHLQAEYYAGVAARYEHILSDLDIRREVKLAQISEAFTTTNRVVVIHGASGQGKTTLALRFLHDNYPDKWRFKIKLVENRQHALSISRAFSAFANTLQLPMAVYIDVSPRDTDWPTLVRELARYPYFQVLVTVREEDYRRANISGAEFNFATIELQFDEIEARHIYERVTATDQPLLDLDFEEAWDRFGSGGPLLEFVYLLNNTVTLHERLREQVARIREEVRTGAHPDELQLLRLVAVASAYSARLNTQKLIASLNLPDPDTTIKRYEKEYLIRLSEDEHWIEGLHPIRSQILCQLLLSSDLHPWQTVAAQVLPHLLEEDLELFILHGLVECRDDYSRLLQTVSEFYPMTWTGIAGVLRSLLWAGINDYLMQNRAIIEEAHQEFGSGWWLIMDLNFGGDEVPNLGTWWTTLGDLIPVERQQKFTDIRKRQTPKKKAFVHAAAWLSRLGSQPREPASPMDWSGLAETIYWAIRLQQIRSLEEFLPDEMFLANFEGVPLEVLGDLSLALSMFRSEQHSNWLENHQSYLETRLAEEYGIVGIDSEDDRLVIHFLPFLEFHTEDERDEEKRQDAMHSLHEETLARLRLTRHLFPGYEEYGSRGYGHRFNLHPLLEDNTDKEGVPAKYLTPKWGVRLNGIGSGLGNLKFRPDSWNEYVSSVLERRQSILLPLQQLQSGLIVYLRRRNPVNLVEEFLSIPDWQKCLDQLNNMPQLPKPSVDMWGFASETSSDTSTLNPAQQEQLPRAIALQKYRPFLDAQNEYFNALRGFLDQALHVIITNFHVGKLSPDDLAREKLIEQLHKSGVKTDLHFLTKWNIAEARRSVQAFQKQFRTLFAHAVEEQLLLDLERQELDLLTNAWSLWYYFANEPRARIPHPSSKIRRNLEFTKQRVKRKIRSVISKIKTQGVRAELLKTGMDWQGSSALWLILDFMDPSQLYTCFEELILALRKELGSSEIGEPLYELIRDEYEYIVLVPLFRGSMINDIVWALRTVTTILSDKPFDEYIWSYIQVPLPAEQREALGIAKWDTPDVRISNEIWAMHSLSLLLASQISEYLQIPSVTKAGQSVLERNVTEKAQHFKQSIGVVIDCMEAIIDRFNTLPEEAKVEQESLIMAAVRVKEMWEILTFDVGAIEITVFDRIVDWSKCLERTQPLVEMVRLYWLKYALETSESALDVAT